MNSPEDPAPEDALADLLLAWDAALQAGSPPPDTADLPPDLRSRLERDVGCLRLLRQSLRPGPAPGEVPLPDLKSDRFEIRRELGRGAHGIVYLAYDAHLGREVALKVARPEVLATPELRDRFLRGARAAAGLDHPNLVSLFEAGEMGLVCYITSAYCMGPTLADWLRQNPAPAPGPQAAKLVATLAEAIHHAHCRGVVHRDLKPSNILLQVDSSQSAIRNLQSAIPKITDFGLAKFLEGPDPGGTASGAVVGTPSYMAPEQAAGKPREVGPPADVYALGAVLYELLTGRPPFRGETSFDTMRQVVEDDPVPPRRLQPRCPRDLETICLRCLAKEPRKRYPSAEALAEDLRRFLGHRPIKARPAGPVERGVKWARRKPALAALIAFGLLATVAALAGSLWYSSLLTEERDRAVLQERRASLREAEAKRLSKLAEERRSLLEERERTGRRLLIAAQSNLAQRAWEAGQVNRVLELLEAQRPREGQEDLRGFEWYYLWRRCHGEKYSWKGWEAVEVTKVRYRPLLALTPDGRTAATPSGPDIKLWDVPAGRVKATLRGHSAGVQDLTFSADGRTLASGAADGTARLWDVAAERCRATFGRHPSGVLRVALSPDGQWLITVAGNGTLKVWEVATGKERSAWKVGSLDPAAPVFAPDGRTLAVVAEDRPNEVTLWDLPTGTPRGVLRGHTGLVGQVVFAPDGKRVATVSEDRTAALWETATGKRLKVFEAADDNWVTWAAFSPDGKTLALGVGHPYEFLKTGRVVLWDTHTVEKRKSWDVPGGGCFTLAFSPDGQRLAAGGNDGVIRVRDLAWGREPIFLYGHRKRVSSLAFAPDGQTLTSLSFFDRTVRGWDLVPRPASAVRPGHADRIDGVAFSPRGQVWASASRDGVVRLRDPESGSAGALLRGHRGGVYTLAFTPDGKTLATGGDDGVIKFWDAASGKEKGTFRGHPGLIRCLAFSPDGRLLVSAGGEGDFRGDVILWDATTGKQVAGWQDPSLVWAAAFSRDGRLLAWGSGAQVTVWNMATQRVQFRQQGAYSTMALAFSPDGKILVAGTWDCLVRRWDVTGGRELPSLKGHTHAVLTVAFSPDGRTLASGGNDGTVVFWEPATGGERFTLRARDAVRSLAFRPDGRGLVAGLRDGRVELWEAADGRAEEWPDARWRKRVAALPPDRQVEAVARMLQTCNPDFDGRVNPIFHGSVLYGLDFFADEVTDLSPLRALPRLEYLACNGSAPGKGKLRDLSPLRDLALTSLRLSSTQVSDLSPLKGKSLKVLVCQCSPVKDLSPVRGMPLEELSCWGTYVTDLSPLQGMRLRKLYLYNTPVADLSPLRGMPLTGLDCRRTRVRDLSPLRGMPLVALLLGGSPVTDLSPLKGLPLKSLGIEGTRVTDLSPLRGMPLEELDCGGTGLTDLSPLRGMRLQKLQLYDTPVADLSPLRGMPLTGMQCQRTRVRDLSPLRGMPIVALFLAGSQVTDLSPLRGLPLRYLGIEGTRVTDLSPLRGMPLEELGFEVKSEKDLAIVRSLKTLKKINGLPATQFWNSPQSRPPARRP